MRVLSTGLEPSLGPVVAVAHRDAIHVSLSAIPLDCDNLVIVIKLPTSTQLAPEIVVALNPLCNHLSPEIIRPLLARNCD